MSSSTDLQVLLAKVPPLSSSQRVVLFVLAKMGVLTIMGAVLFPFTALALFPVFHEHPWLGLFIGGGWATVWALTLIARVQVMASHTRQVRALLKEVPTDTLHAWMNTDEVPREVASAIDDELDARKIALEHPVTAHGINAG